MGNKTEPTTANVEPARWLESHIIELAAQISDIHFEAHPELLEKYGPAGKQKCTEDARYHLLYLSEAIKADSSLLFTEYCNWARVLLEARKIPAEDLHENLIHVYEVLSRHMPAELAPIPLKMVETAIQAFDTIPMAQSSFLDRNAPNGVLAEEYLRLLLEGKRQESSTLILDAVKKGVPVKDIYMGVFQPAQYEVGRLWQTNKINVAQEHYCTAATQLIMAQLYNYILSHNTKPYSVVAACTEGDYHEMGLRMVSDIFEMEGFDTFYLGANVPTTSLIGILQTRKPDLLLLSATMTYHVRAVSTLIEKVRATPGLEYIKIMVGGYPFKLAGDLWKKVGADGFATDADEAVEQALALIKEI